uniref:VWFD domain-containing protein n=1 Tax=Otus sunia TaxID=257818 RepID=A0A8C8EBB2_9STRI
MSCPPPPALSCPKNSNYSACGPACPPTCNAAATPASCGASACVETCQCREGFAFDANECVPQGECGCVFEGRLHGLREEFWGDNTCTKRCVCDGEYGKAVCQWATCRAEEECRVEEGIRGCYPKSHATCAAVGATHYQSFDGGKFIFQGTCLYQLAGLCEKNRGLVDFQVLVQNGRQDDERLSSIALVMVKVYGRSIVINVASPHLHVPHFVLLTPTFSPRLFSSTLALVETDFGLTVTYDWQSQVTVSAPSTYANALCGLCGNYNGDAGDEMMMKNGQVTPNSDAFGHSWKVTDIPGCVERSQVECPATAAALQQQKASKEGCGIMLEEDGPFGSCRAHVDPTKYFQSCVHEFCLFPDQKGVICPIIARYTSACQAAGVTIGRWRTKDFCSVSCPANSHYEICSQSCSQICSSIYVPVKCSGRCREGCVCNDGFVLSGDECVPMSKCGCLEQDFYYKVEETFFPTKQEQCQCQAGGAVTCQKFSCPEGSEGKIVDGVFQCQPATLGACVATGDRSYLSFDGTVFDIPGTCSYILTETCSGDDVANPFVVKIKKEARQKRKVSGIQTLSVEVYGLTLTLTRGKRGDVMVRTGFGVHLFLDTKSVACKGQVQVHQHGTGVLLQTDFGLVVHYDLLHHVTVTVPQSYRGHLCGLCGNYNGERNDDLLLPSGQQAPNAMAFGSAWKTPDVPCSDDCPEDDCPVCKKEKKVIFQKPNYCGILTVPKGPFDSCHHLIDPALYFEACLHDLCLAEGDTHVLCQSIQSYATACQDAGVSIEAWRRPSFCPLSCPANSSYSLCTNLCVNSCTGLVDASKCPKTCVEGCRCEDGYIFDGEGCVPKDQCGCFVDGKYYKVVVSLNLGGFGGFLITFASRLLQRRSVHGPKQAKCVPSLVSTCWAWGDPHYKTFDGLNFDFQGTCTYTMAESCGNDTALVPFKVEGKNDIRGGVKSVSYVTRGVPRALRSALRPDCPHPQVNGVVTLLPVSLEGGKVNVTQSGFSAALETDFGLRVMYDWNWHLQIDLPSSYYKHTCGLCGNFNLKPEDDVPEKGNNIATTVAWAEGWKVPDDEDPFCWDYCEGNCPVCEEEKKELYGGNHYCGLIKKTFQGPFKACHDVVNPREFYRNCLYDVCLNEGAKKILCEVLEAYATTCKKRGAAVHDWRTPSGCRKRGVAPRGVRRRGKGVGRGQGKGGARAGRGRCMYVGLGCKVLVWCLGGLQGCRMTSGWVVRSLRGVLLGCKVIARPLGGLQACRGASWWPSKLSRGTMQPPPPFQVNGILVELPYNHDDKIHVYLSGLHGFIKTDFEVVVTFDWYSYARVIIPTTYSRAVCGLCGNADGNPEDDLALRDGSQATDVIQFADSWKVADVPGCWAGCTENCQFCTKTEQRPYRGDKHCGLLVKKQGPFAACHGTIDPGPYFDNCLFDTCLYKGHQESVCRSIGAYVTACQSQGVRVGRWRTAAFCSTWATSGEGLGGCRCEGFLVCAAFWGSHG